MRQIHAGTFLILIDDGQHDPTQESSELACIGLHQMPKQLNTLLMHLAFSLPELKPIRNDLFVMLAKGRVEFGIEIQS
jgi:hypothetical protein